jgi:hypothetical protein
VSGPTGLTCARASDCRGGRYRVSRRFARRADLGWAKGAYRAGIKVRLRSDERLEAPWSPAEIEWTGRDAIAIGNQLADLVLARIQNGIARAAPATTRSWPRARPPKRPCAPSNGRSATPSSRACRPAPRGPRPARRAREGSRGTTLSPARPAHTPGTGSSDKPLPDLATTLRPEPAAQRLALPMPGAGPGIPRSLPPCRRRRRRSRWSARSGARTNDLDLRRDGGHTRPPGRPGAKDP